MEPVTVVVAALLAGAAAGASEVVSMAVQDAYQGLRGLVLGRLRGGGVSDDEGEALIIAASDQQAGRVVLTEELTRVGVDEPTVEAAERLLELLEPRSGKFVVDASQARGLIVGDCAVQNNTFN